MQSLGIVGLGLIGSALANRFLSLGDTPRVFDLRPDAVAAAVERGAVAAGSCRELAQHCEAVLVCVQTDEQCMAVVSGENGLLEGVEEGCCIAVLSTVKPSTINSLAELAASRGAVLVDSPLAGRGMFSVEEGTMTALVGDAGETFQRLKPVLERFSSHVLSAGGLGSGAALKLAHNVVVYAGFAALVEAEELVLAAGVREGLLEEVAGMSGALSELSGGYMQYYKHFRDDPHSDYEDNALRVAAALLNKDLTDAVELAESFGLSLPVASLLSHAGAKVFPAD
jgi:3-hydroxyisobutyrate dehydrogenase-like beta-hydroxyacid dehydrogenase